jgi:hypothetical protein
MTSPSVNPAIPGPAYNLARAYAQNGDYDQSVAWLKTSADRGFSYLSTVLREEDLDEVHNREGYAAALDLIRKNNAAELEIKACADKAIVITTTPPHSIVKPALIVALHGYADANDDCDICEVAAKIGRACCSAALDAAGRL